MPIEVGWKYNLTPNEASNQWVEVVDIYRGYVYVNGLDRTTAAWSIPAWRFDDIVSSFIYGGAFVITEVSLLILGDEYSGNLLWM